MLLSEGQMSDYKGAALMASENAAFKGLTEDRTRSLAHLDQNLLASRAATTEVLTLALLWQILGVARRDWIPESRFQ
jgi:hypothetical protein